MRTGAANEANLLHDEFTGNAVAEVEPLHHGRRGVVGYRKTSGTEKTHVVIGHGTKVSDDRGPGI
jgi:hypothetical protein